MSVFIIAEAGVNHNGDIKLAEKLIDAAVEAGADAVKFQTWKTELLVAPDTELAEYQKDKKSPQQSQFELLKALELSYSDFRQLKQYCDAKGIIFMSTPDEEESATFLRDIQDVFKIGSGELTNLPLLKHIARFGKPIILSTGMGTLQEVANALDAIESAGLPLTEVTVLHAVTEYPAPVDEANLNAMKTLAEAFNGIKVGYSDHTLGIEVPIAAVAMGASVIEKHFTLDKSMQGPDHMASLCPEELTAMVRAIRNIEQALGDGVKQPSQSELKNKQIVRKSLFARCAISAGTKIECEMLIAKRPATGICPSRLGEIEGTVAKKDYKIGEMI